jgi:hypothetical protein
MSARAGRRALSLGLGASVAALALPEAALAHGLASRQDLPVPAWLFAWGASLVLIVSFALLSVAWTSPRLAEERWRPVTRWLSTALVNPVTDAVCGLIGVGLLVLVVYAGIEGTDSPSNNFSVVFIFVTFWLGLVVLSVLFGDVFRAFNPWRAIGRAVSGTFRLVAGQRAPAALSYPERLGYWPAVIGIFAFVWLELVYGASTLTRGLTPHVAATAVLVYSAYTFTAMALFGVDRWIEKGEAFSVYLRMFSRLSFFEVRDGRLGRRRALTGAPAWGLAPGAVALVLVAIGATSFDGAQEGLLNGAIKETYGWVTDLGFGLLAGFRINNTIWILLVIGALACLYLLGIRGMHTVSGAPPVRELARSFSHTLIPIALAYLVAHYFSFFYFFEQAQFGYLLSDPLGNGSDLFGTADYGINYALGANAIWYTQVGALVVGHVIALTLAHDRALVVYGDVKSATRSQYFMLAVMVAYTCFGLFLLSQSNG